MTLDERLERFLGAEPAIPANAYVSSQATLIGDVRIGENASVWPDCVLRGDINYIQIGDRSNVQDGTIVHLSDDFPVIVGNDVTVGHAAILHACVIEDECLIGMGATVMDGAVVGHNSIIGARALVTQRTRIPPGSLVVGSPATVTRSLTAEEQSRLKQWAAKYVTVAAAHKAKFGR